MAKVMISMPDDLLKRIDRRAKQLALTRSAFLRVAAEREVAMPTQDEIRTALAEGQAALAGLDLSGATAWIREDRDTRKH